VEADQSLTAPEPEHPRQGSVYISEKSPLTGERELYAVVSADTYNAANGPSVLVAEIETGTRYRATAYAIESDYGVVLADRVVWLPLDMLGEYFGSLSEAQRVLLVGGLVSIISGR
jgi:mRNA-degrading endonuclease toxin of MazEF toxin-antitoxin module